jgi:hypothetical protein
VLVVSLVEVVVAEVVVVDVFGTVVVVAAVVVLTVVVTVVVVVVEVVGTVVTSVVVLVVVVVPDSASAVAEPSTLSFGGLYVPARTAPPAAIDPCMKRRRCLERRLLRSSDIARSPPTHDPRHPLMQSCSKSSYPVPVPTRTQSIAF